MFTCTRYSDAVRMAVYFSELKWQNWEHRYGRRREEASTNHVAYNKVNDWLHYMPCKMDQIIADQFPEERDLDNPTRTN